MYQQTGEPPQNAYVQRAIHNLTLSVEPRKWWDGVRHLCKTRLPDVAWRIHSAEPHSLGLERVNKYLKTVDTPARSSMAAERVIKATFVYANLRLLNSSAAELDEKLMNFLATDTNDDTPLHTFDNTRAHQRPTR